VTLHLAAVEREGLRAYLERVLALDDRAAVRVQAGGLAAGVWSGPPFGVLALRPVGLLEDTTLDATVSARRLLEGLGAARPFAVEVRLPQPVVGPAWAAQLPPRAGWKPLAEVPVTSVADQVAVGVEAFRRRADALEDSARTPEVLERIADDIWGGASVADLPLRVGHAAERLGFLGAEGEVRALASGAWRRLACPGGSILWSPRTAGNGPLSLDVFAR
jgi:hypothetical protein